MKKLLLITLLSSGLIAAENDHTGMHGHSHEGHLHETMVDGNVFIGNEDMPNKIIHVTVLLLSGRSDTLKETMAQSLFDTVKDLIMDIVGGSILYEIIKVWKKKN